MKKPGPGVAMSFTGVQVVMSMTCTTPSFRFGLASTGLPRHPKVMPEPRCGMPASGRLAMRRRTSRLTTCALGLPSPLGRVAPSTWR